MTATEPESVWPHGNDLGHLEVAEVSTTGPEHEKILGDPVTGVRMEAAHGGRDIEVNVYWSYPEDGDEPYLVVDVDTPGSTPTSVSPVKIYMNDWCIHNYASEDEL